jgi:hypothetical protein
MGGEEVGEHVAEAAAHIDDRPDRRPAARERGDVVGAAMPRAHERVKALAEVSMFGEVVPEGAPEEALVARAARADEIHEPRPGACEAPTDSVEVEPTPLPRVEQCTRGLVHREATGLDSGEDAALAEVGEHRPHPIRRCASPVGETLDVIDAIVDQLWQVQGHRDPKKPRRRQIRQSL